jgi:predicted ATPase
MNVFALTGQHKGQSSRPEVRLETATRRPAVEQLSRSATHALERVSNPLSPQAEMQDIERGTPLVGRESELAQLRLLFEKALQGQRQVVFLAGEPGIGKTALVDAFLTQLQKRTDVRTTSGQCVEQYGPGEAYLPLLEATTRLCRGPGGARHIEAMKRYAPSWLAQLPSLLEPQEFERLQQSVQGTSRERMLREMAEAAEGFTTQRGLVVVLEDLHWSDASTLDWVLYIARRREPAKLLILGTYRPADVLAGNHALRGIVQELQARQHCEELRLTPLAEEAIGEYLTERFAGGTTGRSPLQALTPVLHRRTGGNPLFIVTMVDDLIRQGALVEDGGRWRLRADAVEAIGEGVPDSLRQLIERQLERLPESERRLLEVAGVMGVEFAAAEVTAGLGTNNEEIESRCEQLARTGQWLRAAGVAEWPDGTISGRYSFRHALYHEVAYAQLAEVRRVQLHRRIAERKESAYGARAGEIATELAVHFEKGRETRRAISYSERAGRNALQRSANAEAVRHLTHALTLLSGFPASEERTRQELTVHLALGTPLLALRGYGAPEVRRHYQQARSLCRQLGDPPDLFPVLWGLWIAHAVAGDLSTAEELGRQLFQFAGHIGNSDLSLQAHHALWTTLVARGDLATCQLHIEQGLRLYQTDRHYAQTFVYGGHDPGACCRIHGGFLYWLLGYPDRALRLSQEALALGKGLSHGQTLAWALSGNAMLHQFRGEPTAAHKAAEEAIALSTEQQFALWAAYSPAVLGWALIAQGKKEHGLAQIQAGLAALRATGTGIWQSQFLALLAGAYGETGQIREGLRVIDEALVASAHYGERFYEAELYRLKGECLLRMGEGEKPPPSSPQECFEKAITIAREQGAKSWELRAATSLARLWQQQNNVDEARQLLEEIYNWFTEGFDTKDLQDAAALLSELGANIQTEQESQRATVKERKLNIPDSRTLTSVLLSSHTPPLPSERVTADVLRLPTPDAGPGTPDVPPPHTFRREGDYWTVSFAGVTCRLKDARGLHYLSYLLQYPHQEFHVLSLVGVSTRLSEAAADPQTFQGTDLPPDHSEGLSDAGEFLDPQARAAYKQRLSELREELAEAQNFHDLGRSEQLVAEIDFLTQELAHALGLGGRARRVGSPAERARVNVTRTIKLALRRIHEHHPALGQHLAATIKTGSYCSYMPDVRMPITWQG